MIPIFWFTGKFSVREIDPKVIKVTKWGRERYSGQVPDVHRILETSSNGSLFLLDT